MQRPSWAPGFNASNAITGDVNQWFDPQAFVLPDAGTFGNVRRNSLRGPNLREVNSSVFNAPGRWSSGALTASVRRFDFA